ncbi:MAG: cytochrome c peroxidase [Gallionella sp.]|jgi:cytochrome c peroxidase
MQSKLRQQIPHLILPLLVLGAAFPAHAKEDLSNWKLPAVPVPRDNPQSTAKVALGKQLIFDIRLSKNNSMSCVSCHLPATGAAGPTPRAFGHGGELGRWVPSWNNSGYYTSLFWDGRAASLEEQTGALPGHMGPITAPGEMGGTMDEVVAKLNALPPYKKQFNSVFGSDATPETVAKAIAAFERTLVARNAPFQRYVSGDSKAISASAKRGFELFRTKARCTTCHVPPILTDNLFHNIGTPQAGPLKEDLGRYDVTRVEADKGRFKTPGLYNSASLAFFMHDGAFSKMSQVIEHYNIGGNPQDKNQDPLILPLKLNDKEKADLAAFMETLTDKTLNQIAEPNLP